jgi:hypothetical protein
MVVYYIDNVNGTDAKSGLREPATSHNHVDSSTANTETVCAALTSAVDNYYTGATIWNRTRGIGAIVSGYVGGTKTLTHGAIAGHVATDEFYLVNAWKTMSKAATTCAVGDIAYYRAGQTETLAAIVNFTNDGTVAAYISIIGMGTGSATLETTDETATEAWHDASTTRPIIDGNNAAYYVYISSDDYWNIKYLDIRNTNSTQGCLNISSSEGVYIDTCVVRDGNNVSGGVNVLITGTSYTSSVIINNCEIKNSNYINCSIATGNVKIINTTFNSGALSTPTGLYVATSSMPSVYVYLDACVFGGVVPHTTSDILTSPNIKIYSRNCKFNSTKLLWIANRISLILNLFEEDAQQVYGAHIATGYLGVAERVTNVVRGGGATSSVKIIPTTYVGLLRPFILQDFPIPTWQVWCPTGAQTITVYVRSYGTWSPYPTAARLYLEAEYVTGTTTGSITRATVVSTQVLSDGTTWVGLQCAVNPSVTSFVNLKLYLGLYKDASTGIYVDVLPVIT